MRLIDGVIKHDSSAGDSFADGLLEYPNIQNRLNMMASKVPEVLLSGHHANIQKWRREQSLINTLNHRPDLLEKADLSKADLDFLDAYKNKQLNQ